MRSTFRAAIWVLCLAFILGLGSASFADQKTTHVKGFTKKNGTHVAAHERKAKTEKTRTKHSASTQPRDSKGRFVRSRQPKHQFMKNSGYPNGRPGYVVDHIVPLACGGADQPSNMQWQTAAEAKAKDKVERRGCR